MTKVKHAASLISKTLGMFLQSVITGSKLLISWSKSRLSKKQFVLLSSILIGITVGIAAVLLKTFAHYIFLLATYKGFGDFKFIFLSLPLIGILLTVLVIKRFFKHKFEKGLSKIHYALDKEAGIIPKEQMYSQIITSSLTVGFGGSAGLEAPIVITGAAFGSNYSQVFDLSPKERLLLLACGIAAGIAAAFNAPISGVLFSLEVLLIDISIAAFTPLIIAAATGALISHIILNDEAILSIPMQLPFDYSNVPFYVLLGVFAGMISVYHSRVFTKVESLFRRLKVGAYTRVIIGGLFLAALIFLFPPLFGEGYRSIKLLSTPNPGDLLKNTLFEPFLNNEWIVLAFAGMCIFIKPVATAITLGSGGNGGNFAPSLFVGAFLGFFLSKFFVLTKLTILPVSNFALVGMAGILSGLYHSPLTAIFLIAEITGGYTLMIPLMIVSSLSFAISRHFEPVPMDKRALGHKTKNYV